MKAHMAFSDSASLIGPVALAIGRPAFPQTLIDTLRAVANVGHCMVFTLEGDRSAHCALGIGNIPIGPDLGVAYSGHFHLADPNREAIFRERSAASPIVLPSFSRRAYSDSYRKIFFEDAEIVDKIAIAIWVENTCFYVNFYRTAAQGRFSGEEASRLSGVAPVLGAMVARHCQEDVAADPLRKLQTLFAVSAPLADLTGREKDVCLRILSGYSSEAISADLGISRHSTLTYRKRAYDKLGISSQNELFGIALRLMALPRSLN
jgi:DNA-binding CsgD family transcriptional regulator